MTHYTEEGFAAYDQYYIRTLPTLCAVGVIVGVAILAPEIIPVVAGLAGYAFR